MRSMCYNCRFVNSRRRRGKIGLGAMSLSYARETRRVREVETAVRAVMVYRYRELQHACTHTWASRCWCVSARCELTVKCRRWLGGRRCERRISVADAARKFVCRIFLTGAVKNGVRDSGIGVLCKRRAACCNWINVKLDYRLSFL